MRRYLYGFITAKLSKKEAGPAIVEVAAAEEAKVPLLLFPVCGLLEVYERGAESGEEGEKCVSIEGRLKGALFFYDGYRGACGVSSWVLVL